MGEDFLNQEDKKVSTEETLGKEETAVTQEMILEDQRALKNLMKYQIEWDVKKIGRAMLGNIVLAGIVAVIITIILEVCLGKDGVFSEWGYWAPEMITTCVIFITMIIANTLPFMRCAKQIQVNSKALFKKVVMTKQEMVIGVLATLGLSAIGVMIYMVLGVVLSYFNIRLEINEVFSFDELGLHTIILAIYVIIVAPITEEYIFRGVLLSGLKRYGERFAIITTSVLFGLIHGNLYQGIGVTLLGLIFAYITIKKESILPAIGLHMANNLYAVMTNVLISDTSEVGEVISVVTWVVLCIIGVIILIKKRAVYMTISNDEKYKGLRLKAMCKSICLWLIVLLYGYSIFTTIVPI